MASTAPGSKATVTIVRNGRTEDVTVQVAKLEGRARAAARATAETAGDGLGLTVEPLTPQMANRLEVPRDVDGVVVTDIDPDGRAAGAGLREGDVIREVDGKPVTSPAELRLALGAGGNRPSLMLVQRGEAAFFATIDG